MAFLLEKDIPIQAYVPDFIYTGALNAIVGSPKAGKSTIVWAMLLAMMNGKEFLGKKTVPGRILYISEQSDRSFKTQMKDRLPNRMYERIVGHSKFSLMTPDDHWKMIDKQVANSNGNGSHSEKVSVPILTWRDRLDWWKKAVKAVNPSVVAIDTFNQYAAYDGESGENDNAMVANRMLELNELKREHPALAVLLLCHTNKASTSTGGKYLNLTAIRGGSAFAGAMDHVVLLNKLHQPDDAPPSRERFVHIESRMTEERSFPVEWLEDGTYQEIPETASKVGKKQSKLDKTIKILMASPELAEMKSLRVIKKELEDSYQLVVGKDLIAQALEAIDGLPRFKKLSNSK